MKMSALPILVLALAACSPTVGYVMENYNNVRVVDYQHSPELAYRVFDRPQDNKMMITGSINAAIRQAPAFGNVKEPAENYSVAAAGWLKQQGRNCEVTSTTLLIEPQYEVTYTCV